MDEVRGRLAMVEADLQRLKNLQKYEMDVHEGMLQNLQHDVDSLADAVESLEGRLELHEAEDACRSTSSEN